jgi:hypothetical protein
MEVCSELDAMAALCTGEQHPVSIGQGAKWVPEPDLTLWNREEFVAPAGNRTPIVQPVARRYIDWYSRQSNYISTTSLC